MGRHTFVLTNIPNYEQSRNILSGLIFGFEVLEDNEELFCSYTSFENVGTLMVALGEREESNLLINFDKKVFIDNDICPSKLYKTEDNEVIYEELVLSLDELENFYYTAFEQEKAVVCVFANFNK